MKIKEFFAKALSKERGKRLVTQFSVPLVILVMLTTWSILLINIGELTDPGYSNFSIGMTLSLVFALIWTVSQQISAFRVKIDENGKIPPLPFFIQLIMVILMTIESFILTYSLKEDILDAPVIGLRHSSIIAAFAAATLVLPFLKQKSDRHLVRWNADTYITEIICGSIAYLIIGIIGGLNLGIEQLFDVIIPSQLLATAYAIFGILFTGSLFLFLLPDTEQTNKLSHLSELLCDKIGKFILLPATCIYLLTLYAYILKIIIVGELPNGGVSYMTTAMMALLLGTTTLIYKALYVNEDNWFSKITRIAFPTAALPVLILMLVGFVRRICDYGWTPMRGYLCVVIIWFFFAIIVLLWAAWRKSRGKEPCIIRILIASLAVLFLVSSVFPKANIYTICKAIQRPDKEPTEFLSWENTHRTYYKIEGEQIEKIAIPEGYTSVQDVFEYDYKKTQPTYDQEGRLILEFQSRDNKWYTVHFDESQTGSYVDMYTEDGSLIRATGLTITDNEGELYINYLDGYLFGK